MWVLNGYYLLGEQDGCPGLREVIVSHTPSTTAKQDIFIEADL